VVAQSVLHYSLEPNVLLNVNVPYLPYEQLRGIRITRQGLRVYHDRLDQRMDPRGKPYYWTAGDLPTGVPERGTDIGVLTEGYVSVTPLQLDLTAYHAIPDLNSWEWETDNLQGFEASVSIEVPSIDVHAA
jgi:5'-nucleotidase